MYKEDPQYYATDFANAQSVTSEDVKNVIRNILKGRILLKQVLYPKGRSVLIAENSVNAGIVEEDVTKAAEVKAMQLQREPVVKTPTKFDRSVQPPVGPDPEVTIPPVWTGSLSNGMKIYGITQNELPLIQYSIVISGGHLLDAPGKAGVASLTASLMNEGTKNKTPEELEDAIKLLGASISVFMAEMKTLQ